MILNVSSWAPNPTQPMLLFFEFWNWGRVRIGTIWGQTGSLIKPAERCLGSANYSLIYMRLLGRALQGDRRMVTLNGQQLNLRPINTGCPLLVVLVVTIFKTYVRSGFFFLNFFIPLLFFISFKLIWCLFKIWCSFSFFIFIVLLLVHFCRLFKIFLRYTDATHHYIFVYFFTIKLMQGHFYFHFS